VIVRISRSASADLEEIADWIALDDPLRADSFVDELTGRCLSLADKSNRFPVARRIGGKAFRKLAYRDYLIFYVVRAAEVEIVHILHGARDWAALLGEAALS
jgi:plasmid stabilization system protein ParE